MSPKPAGWYQDTADARGHRYWDGETWVAAPAPIDAVERPDAEPDAQPDEPKGAATTPG